MTSILITGANRGIGLGLVQQFIKKEDVKHIFATARDVDAATELKELGDKRVVLIQMSVTDDDSIQKAVKQVEEVVGEDGLDFLINNAGIEKHITIEEPKRDLAMAHFETNSLGAVMVSAAFHPLLKKAAARKGHAQIVNISSTLGSIATGEGNYPGWDIAIYGMSKAALNRYTVFASKHWQEDNIRVTSFCPGWVKTDMGTQNAFLTVEESTSVLSETILGLTAAKNGQFITLEGEHIDW